MSIVSWFYVFLGVMCFMVSYGLRCQWFHRFIGFTVSVVSWFYRFRGVNGSMVSWCQWFYGFLGFVFLMVS